MTIEAQMEAHLEEDQMDRLRRVVTVLEILARRRPSW